MPALALLQVCKVHLGGHFMVADFSAVRLKPLNECASVHFIL